MKKDLDYIAAVEKAIAEKYGKNTVQDFRSMWDEEKEKAYLAELKDQTYQKKSSTSRHGDHNDRKCPVCKTYSFSAKDDLYMNRFQCYRQCYTEFIGPSPTHEKKWQDGWRPTEAEVEARMSVRRQK